MWESKFPTSCSFTGFSGCPVYLVQEGKKVADAMSITWRDDAEKGLFAGALVIYNAETDANPSLPLHAEVHMRNEENELKVVRLEELQFVNEYVPEQAIYFIAKRVVVEEYHQLPLEEEL